MRKPIALLFAAALVLGLAGMANAQATYTWTLVESESVALFWPNEAGSPNIFEADGGLLGRVIADTSSAVLTACELAPSYPCAASSPRAAEAPGDRGPRRTPREGVTVSLRNPRNVNELSPTGSSFSRR